MQQVRETDVEARRHELHETSERSDIVYDKPGHCAYCGKKVIVRASTPRKHFGDGKLHVWCKRCWFVRLRRGD